MDNNNEQNLNTPQQSPIEPTPSVSKKLNNKVVIVVVILVLIIGGIVGVQFYRPHSAQLLNELNAPVTPTAGSWYTSNTENLRFIIPTGWVVSSDFNSSLPRGFKNPAFVLQKTGSACTIFEPKINNGFAYDRKEISRADRVFSNYTQFDGSWWLASTSDSERYSFSRDTRQYLPGEFRISTNLRNDPFILFMNDGASVPDDCNNDFNVMLKTVEPYYETVSLTSSSKGTLTTEKVWDDSRSNAADKSYEHLVFTADGSKEKREVMKIPTDTWEEGFSVVGRKLYFPSNLYKFEDVKRIERFNSAIYVIDPFTGETSQISGSGATDSYISSLYVRDGVAYYIAGNSTVSICLAKFPPCATDLYSIPLGGGKPTLIARSLIAGSILSYVEGEKAFYIRQDSASDSGHYTYINRILDGKEEVLGKFEDYGSGENQAADKQTEDQISAIMSKAGVSKISSNGVRVENGTLQPAIGEVSDNVDLFPLNATFYFDK